MLDGQRVSVVMPAYNAASTLETTLGDLDRAVIDDVILVDDASQDTTALLARKLGLYVLEHEQNRGYGANQKTCYAAALERGADVVVMVHPDYQYDPRLVGPMAQLISRDVYDVVIGSRILGGGAMRGGMPLYKYAANRVLTETQNFMVRQRLSEYHTGLRAFSRRVLEQLPLLENSDDFVFDNQILAQVIYFGYRIGEVSCPTRYFAEASSINFARSCRYGLGVLGTSAAVALQRLRLARFGFLDANGRRLAPGMSAADGA